MKFVQPLNAAIAVVCLSVIVVLVTYAEAGRVSESSPSTTVTGEVSKIEGEFRMAKGFQGEDTLEIVDKSYVITDQAGQELRFELSDETKVPNKVNPGDWIEVKIAPDGLTLSVTRLE